MAGDWIGTTYYGDDEPEKVRGSAASEAFYMRGGEDTVFGGDGNDFIEGQLGIDVLDGGAGADVLTGEILTGGADGDTLLLEDGAGRADGGDGDDTIRYDESYDARVDTIIGGDGDDVFAISIETNDFELSADRFVADGKVVARLSGIEAFDVVFTGSADRTFTSFGGDDSIRTASGDDRLSAGEGDDEIRTYAGSDTIDAGAGDDVVETALGGRDRVELGAGRDVLRLEDQFDTAVDGGGRYDGGAGADALDLRLSLAGRNVKNVSFANGELRFDGKLIATFENFERFDFTGPEGLKSTFVGGDGDDFATASPYDVATSQTFSGGVGDDTLSGGAGSDRLAGGDGDDLVTLSLDAKADTVSGGDGFDRLVYGQGFPQFDGALKLTGDIATNATLTADGKTIGRISGFEALQIAAGAGDDTIVSGSGDDSISAGLGANVVDAGTGDDTVRVASDVARDDIDMGGGDDLFSFGYADAAVVMTGGSASMTIKVGGKVAAVVKNAETFDVGGSDASDSLLGGAGDDRFSVGQGADTVRAGGGDDEIYAFLADDGKRDVVVGGDGQDFIFFNAGFGSPIVMKAVGATGFTLTRDGKVLLEASEIERLSAEGSSGDDVLVGLSGDDTLIGGAGVDKFIGGKGSDTVDFYGEQAVNVTLAAGKTVIAKVGAAKESLNGIENLKGSFYDDTLTGDAGDNVITDDIGAGARLDGGRGVDTLVASAFEKQFRIDLLNDDNLKNFENLRGSYYYADTLLGTDADNVIESGGGTDVMTGRGGADVFAFTSIGVYTPITKGDYERTHAEVTDFSRQEKDRIDVSQLIGEDENFRVIGQKAFTGAGNELRFVYGKTETYALVDLDGDALADFAIKLAGGLKLTEGDFIL